MSKAIPSQDQHKTCNRCGQSKPIALFYNRPQCKYGVAAECKVCIISRTSTRYRGPQYDEIRSKNNLYGRDKRLRVKDLVFRHYGGWKCACCGEDEPLFLTLDHINNDGGEFRKKHFGKQGAAGMVTYRWLILHGFVDGLQVLCANCQHGKRLNNGVCPHMVRRNDQDSLSVGSSEPKRIAPHEGDDMVYSA